MKTNITHLLRFVRPDTTGTASLFTQPGKQYPEPSALAPVPQISDREMARREALPGKALQWLEIMDPTSFEGRWFTRFAQDYPNPLDAAIAYLDGWGE